MIGLLMLINGLGPLHIVTTQMVIELDEDDLDGDRLDRLFGKAMQWGLLQSVFILSILVVIVGLRGL